MRNFITLALLAMAFQAAAESVPRFGVNQDFVWTRDEQIPRLIQAVKDAHVQAVRIEIRWHLVEPEPGKWDFTRVDAVVHALRDAKIEVLPVLMSVPAWASSGHTVGDQGILRLFAPQRMQDWQEYVRQVVSRYRKEIRFWEIWNEENGVDFYQPLPNATQYVSLLKTAHDTIKSIDPKATVVLGGLQMNGIIPNPWTPMKTENFLQQIYDAGGRRYFDVVNIHPYVLATREQGPAYAAKLVRDTVRVMKNNGDRRKPLWITETGVVTDNNTTEQMQADHLSGMYRELGKIRQVKAIYWYKLLSDLDKPISGGEDTMGLVAVDGRRKPAFEALKKAVTE